MTSKTTKDFFANIIPEDILKTAEDCFQNDTGFKQLPWMKNKTNKKENNTKSIKKNPLKKTDTHSKTLKTSSNNYDRFIPNRDFSDETNTKTELYKIQNSNKKCKNNNNNNNNDENINKKNEDSNIKKDEYKQCIKATLINKNDKIINNTRVLSYVDKPPISYNGYINNLSIIYKTKYNNNKLNNNIIKKRNINKTATKILDAPDLIDNYYINILDWSKNNIISIALNNVLYLFNCETSQISTLYESNNNGDSNIITGVKFTQNGNHISLSLNNGIIYLYDVNKKKKLRTINTHEQRVGSLAWNKHILSAASQDTSISNHDVRQRNHLLSIFKKHEQEICGLKWSFNGKYLASGGNDNKCCVYEYNNINNNNDAQPLHILNESNAAIKALSFCPWNDNIIATGGGTSDKCIRIYDITTGNITSEINTESQVCSILFNPHDKEILSSHGYSKYQLSLWNYPSLNKLIDLTGHSSRVLHTAINPDGTTICSAASDETLRFWNIFEINKNNKNNLNNNLINSVNIKKQNGLYAKIR